MLKNKTIKNNIPGYLDKQGEFVVRYEKQALGKKVFKKTGELKLSKTNILVKTQIKDYDSIREAKIKELGLSVLRFSNTDVFYNPDFIELEIKKFMETKRGVASKE